ncbi:cobyrinate a,c-diamide synthase [Desulfolutivibrio sulfoxidireducens]|uniref:cobyrinate a,c-diamide synthase n=1 Tax=Desulfolutivibrio sulfoxidireducens TaxID=2773299 RepID=UPI00159DDB63|nr:cobyrinate a,c-diamide synthase [Desulfolutivibrio sulfoxidireducens]QLA18708.1 cobyrinate a,c-diamide synthase [Desulfolutivibrio sulfoxidireducens]
MSNRPRLVLAGLSGGAGKTIVTLGVCRALARRGLTVRPFKKGPDYIDASWLGLAAGREASNLDPFLLPADLVRGLFFEKSAGCDISVIEGNRGLFDGKDLSGSFSTAELARLLCAPVVLVLDATKMTRTAAAIVAGCAAFESGLSLAGVICNRTAGERHRSILRRSIEEYTGIPVLGMLPKMPENPIPERHMGLLSNREYDRQEPILDTLADCVADCVDLDRLLHLAGTAPDMEQPDALSITDWAAPSIPPDDRHAPAGRPRIGVVRDAALWFYYPENLEALTRAGADISLVSLLSPDPWPELDGLYLGGGFPETMARALADNLDVRDRVRGFSRAGMPIYAECGGFMYLCRELRVAGETFPMAGVFPLTTTLCPRPQGLGYSRALVRRENPFHPVGFELAGHEFHYSRCLACLACLDGPPAPPPGPESFCLEMKRGAGMLHGLDGLLSDATFAAYTHIHALGTPHWAGNFVAAARAFRARREKARP